MKIDGFRPYWHETFSFIELKNRQREIRKSVRTMAQTEQLTSSIRVGNQYQDQSARAMKQQVHRPFTSQRKEKTKQLNRVSSMTIVPKLGASTSQAITTGGYSIESLLE